MNYNTVDGNLHYFVPDVKNGLKDVFFESQLCALGS